jgi:hypothetical protein
MEYTKEFLMGMFAAYMGCECEIMVHDDITTKIKSKMSGIVSERVHFAGAGLFVHFSKIKPILTPLSEISDEDLIRILGWEHHKDIEIRQKKVSIEGVFCSAFCTNSKGEAKAKGLTSSLIFNCLPLRHTDYLRSKKYDCGYLHISSLIQAGLAVKLQNNA